MRRGFTFGAVAIALALTGSAGAASARGSDGPPYDGSAQVNDGLSCTNANVCTSEGDADATTGGMSQHTTVDIGGGTADGGASSFIVREMVDAVAVPDGWPKATVTITYEVEEAHAALTGSYGDGDEVEGYMWAYVQSSACPSCSDSTGTTTLARHRAGVGVGPAVVAVAPGTYSLTFETADPYDGARARLGTLTVGLRHLTILHMARQQYSNPSDAFGLLNGPVPQRRAEVSTRITVTSISIRRAGS